MQAAMSTSVTTDGGSSLIGIAAEKGHADCLKLLLDAGGDVNKCDNDGRSPISRAAENGHADCLELLLGAGGDVNKCDDGGSSPISIAAEEGYADCLELLLDAGGDVNKCDDDGRSPIYLAAENGNVDCLELLLDAGGDVNKCDGGGRSPNFRVDLNIYVSPSCYKACRMSGNLFKASRISFLLRSISCLSLPMAMMSATLVSCCRSSSGVSILLYLLK
jgi:ankyrin repeat protein